MRIFHFLINLTCLIFLAGIAAMLHTACELGSAGGTGTQSELTVSISPTAETFGTGIHWAWFDPLTGSAHPWGPDSAGVLPDSSRVFFKIDPVNPEFLALSLQNSLHFGVIYLGQGDSLFESDYLGDSLEFSHDLVREKIPVEGDVYYIRVPRGACQLIIDKWQPEVESLIFRWRALSSWDFREVEFNVELPEIAAHANQYWFRVLDGDVEPAPKPGAVQLYPEGYEFYINPASAEFFADVLPAGNYGIAYLGAGETLFNSSAGEDNRENLPYLSEIEIAHFQAQSVFFIRMPFSECKIMFLSWDKSGALLRFRWKSTAAPE